MTAAVSTPFAARPLRVATRAAVTLALMSALWAAWYQDWTYDEPPHIRWAERFLASGLSERESEPRFTSQTPINVLNVIARNTAQAAGIAHPRALRFAARLPTVGVLLALLATVFLVSRAFFGEGAAHLATLAAALDPNLIAHGSLATSDEAFALGTLLTLAAGVAFAARPSPGRGAALGAAVGLAFAAKFTAVLLLPALLLIPAAVPRTPGRPFRTGRLLVSLATAVATACLLLGAAYLFHDIARPLSAVRWRSGFGERLAQTFPALRLPLPMGFLTGVDFALGFAKQATGHRPTLWLVMILGRRYLQGVWFYFGLLWLIKTPLLVLAALVLGLVRAARAGLLVRHPGGRYLALNLAIMLGYLSFFFPGQLGYRFALMCVPLASILAAAGLASLEWRPLVRVGLAVVLLAVVENAMYLGNPLAFTNAAIWPKRRVFRLIADSNVDWGQNREKIQGWMAEKGMPAGALDPVHLLPGTNVFSLNVLAGLWDFEQHRWLREHVDPQGHLGHTYLWFHVDDDLYARFLTERRRIVPDAAVETLCGDEVERTPLPPGSRQPLTLSNPVPGEVWIACVATKKGAQFGLRSVQGHVNFGPCRAASTQGWDTLLEQQVAWYLLEPGRHALCVRQVPNRRAWLPNVFDGYWLVREHSASLALRRGMLDERGQIHVAPSAPSDGLTSAGR